jgi:hypothetical protein
MAIEFRSCVTVESLLLGDVPSSAIRFTVMIESTRSSETSILTRATRRHIPEDGILHSQRRENLTS